jgi:flagellar L-ring protein FlgH
MNALRFLSLLALTAAVADAGSLWTSPLNPERSLVADRKASRKGDILTVAVSESFASQSTSQKKSSSESSVDAGVESFLFPGSGLGTHNGVLPKTTLGGKNEFSGGGQVNNSQSLSARAAVLVTDVLPNGNLVIQGVRSVKFSGESQYVVLHGLVRPDDIVDGNLVYSANIADVRIEFVSEGSLTDAQKKGWITRLYEKLRPY